MTGKRWLALVVIVLAVVVNYPLLADWLGARGRAPASSGFEPEEPEGASPAPSGVEVAPRFQPVVIGAGLVDPFLHEVAPAPAELPQERRLLPRVTLILRTSASRRAVVDGRTLAIGDQIELGTIERIDAAAVTVRTPDGTAVVVPLAPASPRGPRRAEGGRVEDQETR